MDIKDKINTILLCDIALKLGITSEIDPDLVKYAITSGNEWILNAQYSSLLTTEEPTKQDRDFVVEVLNMYRGLSAGLRKLSVENQKIIIEKHKLRLDNGNIQIPGFDGNNEIDYFRIVEAFLTLNKFSEQKSPIQDTHTETYEDYHAMVLEYKKLDAPHRSFKLTYQEIEEVLKRSPSSI